MSNHISVSRFVVRKPHYALGCGIAIYPDGHIESSWWQTAGMFASFTSLNSKADIVATTSDAGFVWDGFDLKPLEEETVDNNNDTAEEETAE